MPGARNEASVGQPISRTNIRQTRESGADVEVLGRLMHAAFPLTFERLFGATGPLGERATGAALRAFGAMPNVWFLIEDGAPVGFVFMRWGNRATPLNAISAFRAMAGVVGLARTLSIALRVPPLPPRWLRPREAYISAMGVQADRRGRGHGGKLLEYAIAEASRRGYRRLSLRVDGENAPAVRFYARHGFRHATSPLDAIFHIIRREFGDVFMTRRLDNRS